MDGDGDGKAATEEVAVAVAVERAFSIVDFADSCSLKHLEQRFMVAELPKNPQLLTQSL